jgi:hypothetical protein
MELQNVTIKLEETKLETFIDSYKAYQVENNGLYVYFCAKFNSLVITVFSSKKGYKAFFSGDNALKEAQFDSAEAAEEYKQAMQNLANTNPELISGFDTMGNAIVEVTNAEEILAESRKASYDATIEAADQIVSCTNTSNAHVGSTSM